MPRSAPRAVPFLAGIVLLAACGASDGPAPMTRTYYVAAEEVAWDYAPTGLNRITGDSVAFPVSLVMSPAPDRIGRVYKKALYRGYTDSSFSTPLERGAEWAHLGYLGPVIRGVVGDTLRIVFRNKASRPYSMHPHGVFYDKANEGALYDDGTDSTARADDAVPPGGTYVYTWIVKDRTGPGKGEGSSIMWMYHSHVEEPKDVNAGLMGPMIITRRGMARADGSPADVDRELIVSFAEIDENVSWYLEDNIQAYAGNPASVPRNVSFADLTYIVNLRETVNGYSFGHLEGLTVKAGQRVRWHVTGNSNFEIHLPHWHGQTVEANHMRSDMLSIVGMEMVTADMVPDAPGTWLLHCHVGPHLDFGMSAVFRVE